MELFSANTTALVNPSSSIADGALTLIVTPFIDCASARRENPPRFIAVELGTVLAGALGVLALGALTLTMTLPRSSPLLAAATSKLEGIALPLGTRVDGALTADPDGTLGVVDGLGAGGRLGLGAVEIFGRLELLGVLGAENEGLEIVATLGRSGTAL